MRRTLLLLAKAATSIFLLYFSLRWVNVSALASRLSRFEPAWIALALGLLTAQVALLAVRWRKIAAACGANLAFAPALQLSFIATFFNQVLPSTVGGDGARIWLLARKGAGWARATYSVLIDRIVGVFALALIVIACLPWTFELIHDPTARTVLLMIGFGAVAGAVIFVLIGTRFRQLLDRWSSHPTPVGRVTGCSNVVRFIPFDSYFCVLDRNTFCDHRCGLVLYKDDCVARQFPAGFIPHASGIVGFNYTDIDRRLGRPREQHDRRFRICWPGAKRWPCTVHPLWCGEFRRRRRGRDSVDREWPADTIAPPGGSQPSRLSPIIRDVSCSLVR